MNNLKKTDFAFILLLPLVILFTSCSKEAKTSQGENTLKKIESEQLTYILPTPQTQGDISVEEALNKRRSQRDYRTDAISAEELSQVLWAAYGITQPMAGYPKMRGGFRTAPSAGATYPLEIYAVVGNVKDVEPGVYKYFPDGHKIVMVIDKDIRKELTSAALNQKMITDAPASLFYSAVFSRTTERYGDRGKLRYVCMDLGHSAENVYLQCEALNLGTCAIGAFNDDRVREVMQLPDDEEPLYIMPIGKYYKSE